MASVLLICVAGLITTVSGHFARPAVLGTACGAGQYSTWDTALLVPDITVQWSGTRVATCDAQVFWVKFFVPYNRFGQQIHLTAGTLHPRSGTGGAGRFAAQRFDAAIFGPGMPAVNTQLISASNQAVSVPQALLNNGIVYLSAQDQTTCANSKWMSGLSPPLTSVVDGVCAYFDPISQTYMTVILDEVPTVLQGGVHYAAFWIRGTQTGKFWVSVGITNGVTDNLSQYVAPVGVCNCGDQNMLAANFFEKSTFPSSAYPTVASCGVTPTPALTSYCPATTSTILTTPTPNWLSLVGNGNSSWTIGCGQLGSCPTAGVYAGTVQIMQQAMATQLTCNPMVDFVRQMIGLHKASISACATLVSATSAEAGLINLCAHILERKRFELAGMTSWLQAQGVAPYGVACPPGQLVCGSLTCPSSQAYSAVDVSMRSAMAVNYQCQVNGDFTYVMLPAHQGGLDLCTAFNAASTPDLYLTALCQNVSGVQPSEIRYLYEWQKAANVKHDSRCDTTRNLYPYEEPCADILQSLTACYQFGGDGKCSCSSLIKMSACGTIYGGALNISQACTSSCGQCPVQLPVAQAYLSAYSGAMSLSAGPLLALLLASQLRLLVA